MTVGLVLLPRTARPVAGGMRDGLCTAVSVVAWHCLWLFSCDELAGVAAVLGFVEQVGYGFSTQLLFKHLEKV
jgi:hypothetical protein